MFEDVAADPTGDGWFVEERTAIHHIADDGTDKVVVTAKDGTWLQLLSSEGTASPLSFDLAGHLDPVDLQLVGLDPNYDFPRGPRALTVSPDGAWLSWITWNMTADEGNLLTYQLTSIGIDGSDRRQFTLPDGPTRADSLDDRRLPRRQLQAVRRQRGDAGDVDRCRDRGHVGAAR